VTADEQRTRKTRPIRERGAAGAISPAWRFTIDFDRDFLSVSAGVGGPFGRANADGSKKNPTLTETRISPSRHWRVATIYQREGRGAAS
jgi:hypothetical protein